MGNRGLIVGGAVSILVLLLVAGVVWAGVLSAATKQSAATHAKNNSYETEKAANARETQGPAKARSETRSDIHAESREAPKEDLSTQDSRKARSWENSEPKPGEGSKMSIQDAPETATRKNSKASTQDRYKAGAQASFEPGPPEGSKASIQDAPEVAARKNSKASSVPSYGEEKKEASAEASPAADTTTHVTAKTCSGGTIELNVAEKQMLDLHNQTRTDYGLSQLCLHPEITAAARAHAQDELDKEYYSHYAPDGSKPADRMKRSGYTLCDRPSHGCGENIDAGSGSNGTPDNSFKELMNSPGHKANILRKEFREVGIGARTGNHEGHEGVVMYVMDFGGEWP